MKFQLIMEYDVYTARLNPTASLASRLFTTNLYHSNQMSNVNQVYAVSSYDNVTILTHKPTENW